MSCHHHHNACQSGCGGNHHHHDGCGYPHHGGYPPFPPFMPPFMPPWAQNGASCGQYLQPICSSAAQYSDAGTAQGATLVIHKIVLEPCGDPTCTPRTYNIRITGPSYPCGETFQLRAGSCTELDVKMVL